MLAGLALATSVTGPASAAEGDPEPSDIWEIGGAYGHLLPYDRLLAIAVDSAEYTLSGQSSATVATDTSEEVLVASFSPPLGQTLSLGTYSNARKTATAGRPGLDVRVGNRECSTIDGNFTVYEITRSAGGNVTTFSASYELNCDDESAPTRGSVAKDATALGPTPTDLLLYTNGGSTFGYAGTPATVSWQLLSARPQTSPVTIQWERRDADGLEALSDTAGRSGHFTDELDISTTTYTGVFAGSPDSMPATSGVAIDVVRRQPSIALSSQHSLRVNEQETMRVLVSDQAGVVPNALLDYSVTNALGTKTGQVTTNSNGRTSVDFIPRAGGTSLWSFTYAGDRWRNPASEVDTFQVFFLETELTIQTSEGRVDAGESVDVKVTLGKTYDNRVVSVYASDASASPDDQGELVARRNLDGRSSFTFTHTIRENTRFRAEFDGDQKYGPALHRRLVDARPRVGVTMVDASRRDGTTSVYDGQRPRARVNVRPADASACAKVRIDVRLAGSWRRATNPTCLLLDRRGEVVVTLTGEWPKDVRYRIRARTRESADFASGTSSWRYFRIV